MLDFVEIKTKFVTKGRGNSKEIDKVIIYPEFLVDSHHNDLMIRGHSFYAIWDDELGLWSKNEGDVKRLIDRLILDVAKEHDNKEYAVECQLMKNFSSNKWTEWQKYVKASPDDYHTLDEKIIFKNSKIKKKDYASKILDYPLEKGSIVAYDELMSVLYSSEEREKLEWAIGAIISGDSKKLQKFIVLYGEAGSGKSTFLNILQMLFDGYYIPFNAKELASANNSFALEQFKEDPLVAIQHDGDLSRIEDNTLLNSIVSHETMVINEKFKSTYKAKFKTFIFLGTNRPVKITEAKSGLTRRLIDVHPSGRKIKARRYQELMNEIAFELGAIAYHCLDLYSSMGKHYYDSYKPVEMIGATNDFFNFVEDNYDIFAKEDEVSLVSAWAMYKEYCEDSKIPYPYTRMKFKEELKNYYQEFHLRLVRDDGTRSRNIYTGFLKDKFKYVLGNQEDDTVSWLNLDSTESIFDAECADCPAQYASAKETPLQAWSSVKSTLSEINTHRLHYVRVPENHIVIDLDLKDKDGNKSLDLNYKAASTFKPTYAEVSKSGSAVHLHYIYDGDVNELSRVYDDGIEVKIFTGNSSLRRKLSKCNNVNISHINSGLPLKGGKKMVSDIVIKNEKGLRTLILKNLHKEIHPGTKPSVDFIFKILNDAYQCGTSYDVRDMRPAILAFALNSTHHQQYCADLVSKMIFCSDDYLATESENYNTDELIFYDVEVFPNLFIVCWKRAGEEKVVKMINPKPNEVEELTRFKLIGFNNRRYDNHILYARIMGYTEDELFRLSQRIVEGSPNSMFGSAYNLSYADVYDFSSKKQSLKKFEIELGLHHVENAYPWDRPLDQSHWDEVAEYCCNDVIATEAVFNARHSDFRARVSLAKIAGGIVNDTNNSLTTKLIFNGNKHPQTEFVYTDLSKDFPGYIFDKGVSTYRGEKVGEGGRVYADPGIYYNVKTFDVASMHPHSIIALNLFGERYTLRFKELVEARLAIKHKDTAKLDSIFGGAFKEYLNSSPEELADLAAALKIVINSVYGLTAAKFDNAFRDTRNIDNIVAKRGALFMMDLHYEVEKRGAHVVHIKTDSIKVDNPTPEIEQFILDYGKKWGYTFEVESEYERMCLVNDAVYVAKEKDGGWTATGAQFAVPYVFKKLFTKEPIIFEDLCETKSVKSALYLDFNENLPDVSFEEKQLETIKKQLKKSNRTATDIELGQMEQLTMDITKGHNYQFVGKVGLFCPVVPGANGGILLREQNGKYNAVTGTKGYRWMESELVKSLHKEDQIDLLYYNSLVDDAFETINKFGDAEAFISGEFMNKPE